MEEHLRRMLLAGLLGVTIARKAATILDVDRPDTDQADGVVLRAILEAANECLGHFDSRPPGERWCDALLHVLDLASFATELG